MKEKQGRIDAIFSDIGPLRVSMRRLLDAGCQPAELEVRSCIPLKGMESLPGISVRSRVLPAAIVGGVLGGISAYLIASFTSFSYPLPTGGMPINPALPFSIFTFEGTALGAILATVGMVFLEAGMPRLGPRSGRFDHRLAEGKILLTVIPSSASIREKVRSALSGAVEIDESSLG